jgi:peptidoglycan hydrolase CwlO-like protein
MLKKISVASLVALTLAVMLSVTALACGNDFTTILNQANASIQSEINKGINDANAALGDMNQKINSTNAQLKLGKISKQEAAGRIKNYQGDFDNLLNAIAGRMITRTDGIVVNLLQEAQRRNIKVTVEYIEVTLAGHVYLVDPLRIIGN